MQFKDVIAIFSETGLSPENLAKWIGISNSTYRRWLRNPPAKEFPRSYIPNVSAGVYRLLAGGFLKYGSPPVEAFIRRNTPEYFAAAITALGEAAETMPREMPHEEKVAVVLVNLGTSASARARVDVALDGIRDFAKWGVTWKYNIEKLVGIVQSDKFSAPDKSVAYGALFYLLLPLDLIPSTVPVFGYIDDFGMLCVAMSYYSRKYPDQFPSPAVTGWPVKK
jgi:hypothetical protein